MTKCAVNGDGGNTVLCTNHCKNEDYQYYNDVDKLCYRSKALADAANKADKSKKLTKEDCFNFCGYDKALLT